MAEEEKAADQRWEWIESRVKNAFKHVKEDSKVTKVVHLFSDTFLLSGLQSLESLGGKLSEYRCFECCMTRKLLCPIEAGWFCGIYHALHCLCISFCDCSEAIQDFLSNADTRLLVVRSVSLHGLGPPCTFPACDRTFLAPIRRLRRTICWRPMNSRRN